jgi:RimJ/RimL family protein N-acetyltransferase
LDGGVTLRPTREGDLPTFFQQGLDPEATRMAAFTPKSHADREAFLAHWRDLLGSPSVVGRTVLVEGEVAGYVVQFELFGHPSIAYWFGRDFWGRGIATQALRAFLREATTRPLYARVAKDNARSVRVLEKCGFVNVGSDRGYANARGHEVEEFIFRLSDPAARASPAPAGPAASRTSRARPPAAALPPETSSSGSASAGTDRLD